MAHEIRCPNCNQMFTLDEAGYADILKQVKDSEYERDLAERLHAAEQLKAAEIKNALADAEVNRAALEQQVKAAEEATAQAVELAKAQIQTKMQESTFAKDAEVSRLKAELERAEVAKDLAVTEATSNIERDRDALVADMDLQIAKLNAEKDAELAALKAKLDQAETAQKLALTEAVSTVERERDQAKTDLAQLQATATQEVAALKEQSALALKMRDEEIERIKQMRAEQSTKMVGETLEQHCQIEFERVRAMAFPRAYFEKDNDVVDNSKGDFVFRDFDEDGNELISIMFDMKNESESSKNKTRNEAHFAKLDKDRTNKGCEYAILVSLLEADNELYNAGIVDVSHRFEKMYVIRPQFFIPMITLLRNAALKNTGLKAELERARATSVDITDFEAKLVKFQEDFGYSWAQASKRYDEAITGIDKAIDQMQKIRKALTTSRDHLERADKKAQDISIKKLTRGNPTMQAKFDEARAAIE